jgi:hypothetical protein
MLSLKSYLLWNLVAVLRHNHFDWYEDPCHFVYREI